MPAPPIPGEAARFRTLLADALGRRAAVTEVTTAYRWLDDAADGVPGITVDRYADWAVVSVEEGAARAELAPLAAALGEVCAGVYVKHRRAGDPRRAARAEVAPEAPLVGAPAPDDLVVDEHGMRLGVALADGMSTGLFTDQRDNRRLVRASAEGARVLNLFAYTGSFSVAAALGGARETVSVDLSKRALGRARQNLEQNGASLDRHRLIPEDAVRFAARAARRGERYDVVILDPPSFGTGTRRAFSVERDYAPLAEQVLTLLAPGGRLLAVTNHRKTSAARLRSLIEDAAQAAGREITERVTLAPPIDHPYRLHGDPVAKNLVVRVG